MDLSAYIREVPDHPEPGINFKDITPLLANPAAFRAAVDWFTSVVALDTRGRRTHHDASLEGAEVVVALDARGFLFGAPVAYKLELPLIVVRKSGKLPPPVLSTEYELEYGDATVMEVTSDSDSLARCRCKRVAIVDDLLATGGTFHAAADLVSGIGGIVTAHIALIELSFLDGRSKLESQTPDCSVVSNIVY